MSVVELGLKGYFVLIGAALLVAAAWLAVRTAVLVRWGLRLPAEVTGWTGARERKGRVWHYFPRLRFRDSAEHDREFTSSFGYTREKWPVGHRLPVLVHPRRPDRVELAQPLRLWLAPAAIALLGAGALFAALH
jgi:Protein of unknown function (DUF3592)